MNNPIMHYFPEQDIIHLSLTDEVETESMELSPNITAEPNADVGLVGVTAITWVVGARRKPYCDEWLHASPIHAAQYAAKPLLRPTALFISNLLGV